MIEMEVFNFIYNGITVQDFPDTINPRKLIIKVWYSTGNEPIKNFEDIKQELAENNYTFERIDEAGYTYLETSVGKYRTNTIPFSNEFEKDIIRLLSGEINKLEYYIDTFEDDRDE